MTAGTQVDLADYDGKKVEIKVVGNDGPSDWIEGTATSASPQMISFKEKGKSNVQLIFAAKLADIRMAPESEPKMKARRLNHAELDNVKRHLVDRHGYRLTDVNAMSPEDALAFHDQINHQELDLSHYHADPPAKKGDADEPDGDED